MTGYASTRGVFRPGGRYRIVVGSVDVTGFRCPDCAAGTFGPHRHTPIPSYSLTEPFAYGATSLEFPQVHAGYERAGQGDLTWAKQGARVQLSRVWDDTSTEVIDYVGVVISIDPSGRVLRLDVGGQFSGRANLRQEVSQMYRSERDVGRWASLAASAVGLTFDPWFGPDTGIDLTHTGGQSLLSWAQYFGAMSQDDEGNQRAMMPTFWGSDTWGFPVKDRTTVHGTAFHDDARVVLSVTDDASEQPNVIYGTGVGPDGTRYMNAKWPNVFSGPAPDYPMAGGANMPVGTADADTVNGDGVTVLYVKLREMGYLPWEIANTGVYTTDFANAVKKVQRKANLSQTGTMTTATWDALWDTGVTGYSINGAYIEPLAEADNVREWNRATNGAILGRNPLYDPTVLRVERFIDYGTGIRKGAMVRNARGILARSASAKNWTGTLRFNNAGLFSGDQSAADRTLLTSADLMPMRDLRPGMNVIIPDFDGGTLFHVSGCDVDADGVTATIDTQARDLVEVREILDRNAESRRDIRREWNAANRPAKHSTAMVTSDENFGELDRNVSLVANKWNIVPMIAGQAGTVNRVDYRLTSPAAESSYMVLTKPMTRDGKGGTSEKLERWYPNPLAVADQTWLETDDTITRMDDKTILVASGTGKQPCGYGSRRKFDDAGNATGAPLTGRLLEDEPFPYESAPHTAVIVYLAIFPDRDCVLKKGKILYCQLDDAA